MWLTVLSLVLALLTARLFLWPGSGPARRADAVVVLSGDFGDRLAKGLELVRAGVAPTLVLDGEPDFRAVAELCDSEEPFAVVCLRPQPDSTRAEARAAAGLAASRNWRTVVVVTNRSHVSRAGLLFRRCVAGRVTMIGTEPLYGSRERVAAIRHEWPRFVSALLRQRSC